MSNNLHQLLHLAEAVRQFGPLWTVSCFPMEDLNGRLKSMVHGSNSAQLQICSTLAMFLHLTTLKNEKLVEGRPAYDFCEALDSKHGRIKRHIISNSVYNVGTCTELHELQDIVKIQQTLNEATENGERYFIYERLLKKKIIYSSTNHGHNNRTNSTFAVYHDQDGKKKIGQIRQFVRIANCLCQTLCHCVVRNYAIVLPCILEQEFSIRIFDTRLTSVNTLASFENEEQAVLIHNLKSVCFYCSIPDRGISYITERVNQMEWE